MVAREAGGEWAVPEWVGVAAGSCVWERLGDSVVGAEGACGGGGGNGGSGGVVVAGGATRLAVGDVEGGVAAVALVAGWEVLGQCLCSDRQELVA